MGAILRAAVPLSMYAGGMDAATHIILLGLAAVVLLTTLAVAWRSVHWGLSAGVFVVLAVVLVHVLGHQLQPRTAAGLVVGATALGLFLTWLAS